jgi:CDP-ribitol ribitolphosphotransferase
VGKIKKALRFVLRLCLVRLLWPLLYRLGCLRPIDPRLVLFGNESWAEPTDNFRPLMAQLAAEGFDCRYFGKRQEAKWKHYLRSARFFFDYARARVLFVDEAFSPSLACRPRTGTALVQVWHGCGAFKKFGYSTVNFAWGPGRRELRWLPMHRHYTHVCVSAPEVIPCYAEAFRCPPERIHAWGAPRTDVYFDREFIAQSRKAVLAAFPGIGARKILLYAPTFRGNSIAESRHDAALDLPLLAAQLGETCALLLKPHPKVDVSLADDATQDFAFDARRLPIETLLCAADLLLADYSSLIFEYALLGRPMLFYAYDLEAYDAARSFYYPYQSFVPGDVVTDSAQVVEGIQRELLERRFDPARVTRFRQRFMSACDGYCTQRLIAQIISNK